MTKNHEMQRKCVELRKQSLTYKQIGKQIGKQLGITRDMVAGHLYRARKEALERGLTDERAISNPSQGTR